MTRTRIAQGKTKALTTRPVKPSRWNSFRPRLEMLEDRTVPVVFSNTNPITIPSSGLATPYPSQIVVSGLTGNITDVNVGLRGFSHTWTGDVDILLVAPTGAKMILMSDCGGSGISSNTNPNFDDAAASFLGTSGGVPTGTWKPTNNEDFEPTGDTFPSPAPTGPYGSTLATFNGINPNGTWSLYVLDDTGGDSGSIANGWLLDITTPTVNNDPFANAFTIAGNTASTTGTNVAFTGETGEPNHAGVSTPIQSAWWQWTPSQSGVATINTFGSNFNTTLGVYTGTAVNALTTIASNDDFGGQQSQVSFNAVAGTTYKIAVDGNGSATGSITLNVSLFNNDPFANATVLSGSSVTANGSTVGYTAETGEPNNAGVSGGHSGWWQWTAPFSGTVTVDTLTSNFDTTLGVYTGNAVNGLTTIGSNDDDPVSGTTQSRVVFSAVGGTTYRISVDNWSGASPGSVVLHLNLVNNAPTLVNNGGPYTISEGQALNLSAVVNDADAGQTLTVRWDIDNNGSIDASTNVVATGANQTVNATLTWAQLIALTPPVNDGTVPASLRFVNVSVTDGIAAPASSTTTLNLNNAPPTATSLNNSGPVNENSPVTVFFLNPTDPSPVDATSLRYSFALSAAALAADYNAASTTNSASFTFDDNGSYTVFGRIYDKDGGISATFTTTVTVNNVPPTATVSNNGPVNEGSNATVSFSNQFDPSGPDTAAGFHYAYDFDNNGTWDFGGDGTYAGSGTATSATVPTLDNPNRVVRARIIDKDNGFTDYVTTITVNNVPPTASGMTNSGPVNEGSPVNVQLTGVFDPSPVDSTSLHFSFALSAAGLAPNYAAAGTANLGTFTFADNGVYTVFGRVYDKDGGISATFQTNVQVNNVAPVLTAPSNQSANEGANVAFNLGSFTDAGVNDNPWTVNVNWGDTTSGSFQVATQGALSRNHTYADNGTYTVTVTVTDKDNAVSNTITFQVTVNNLAPVLTAPSNQSANEGANVAFNLGSFTDAGVNDNPWTVNVNWGDTTSGSFQVASQGALSRNHTYADNGTFTVTVTVTDKDNAISNAITFQVVVSNLAPVLTGPGNQSANEGTATLFNLGSFTDSGVNDNPWTVNVNWGDTTSGSFQVNSQGALSGNHSYVDNGTYTVSVTVTDKDSAASNTITFQVTVNNVVPVVTPAGNQSANEGASTVFNIGSFSDLGVNDNPWTVNIAWGDTNSTSFTLGTQGVIPAQSHTYVDSGTYTVTVTVTDKDGGVSAPATFQVVVNNLAPVLTGPSNQSSNEGANALFNLGSFTDAGTADNPWTVNVNWGDTTSGSFQVNAQGAISRNHTYADNGTYTVSVFVTDKDGANSNTITFQVTVSNLAPILTAPGNQSAPEGTSTSFNLGSFSDAGTVDNPWTVNVNWGDTTSGSFQVNAQGAISGNHTYADNGTFTVSVFVTDKDGATSNTITFQVTVNNVAPILTGPGNQSANEGANVAFNLGSFTDPGVNDNPWTVNVNWGDTTSGSFQVATQGALSRNHTYADNGTYTVTVTVTDKDGGVSNVATFQVVVSNLAPVLTGPSNQSANEGANVAFNLGSFTDAGVNDNPWTVNVSWGDTTSGSFQVNTQGALSRTHTYADNGTYTVTVTVTDKDGGISNVATFQVVVSNLAPVLTGPANQSSSEGSSIFFNLGSFTDAGVNDNPWTVNVVWGDTTSSSFQVGSQGAIGFNHTFADNGTYVVSVSVTDKDGGVSNTATFQVVVSNLAPVLTGPGNQSANEGNSASFNLGSFTDPGINDNPWTVAVTWGDTGSNSFTVGTQGAINFNHTYQDNGTYTVNVTVTDKDGAASNTISFQVTVANLAPGAGSLTNNGPVNEGSPVTVSFVNPTDPSPVDAGSLHYSFALTAAGLAANYAAAGTVNAASFTFADNGSYVVFGRVYDKDGGISTTFQTTVIVNNVAPTVTSFIITGGLDADGLGQPNVPISFQAAATDPGALDSFTYEFDWNYNGTTFNVQDTIGPIGPAGRSPVNINHTYTAFGSYQPAVRVTDKDGSTSVIFLGPQVNVGSVFMSGGNLIIYGTNAMDNIAIDGTNRAAVRVSRNSQVYNFGPYDLSAGGRVIVYCRDGNDVVTVTGTVSTEIYGGNGNDNLNGGGGNDVIFGEAGDDYIALGSGDDVGIGGMGKDQLTGGNGNDVLVGGHVSPLTYNWAQLQSVVGTWNSWNSTGLVPPPLTALRDATTDPADLANMDNYYGDTGKDLFIYRSTGPAPDKISLFSPAEKDYLLALL